MSALPIPPSPTESSPKFNTSNLLPRIGSDAAAAIAAGTLVAPIITIIDRGIIENSSGRNSLGASIRQSLRGLIVRPHHFFVSRPFRLIFALYSGTYLTANSIDTLSSTLTDSPATTVTHGPAKFAATTTANISLCLYKDSQFTQMFRNVATTTSASAAASAVAPRVPFSSFALFGLRDCLTVFASFNLPPMIAPHLPLHLLGPAIERSVSSANVAQFLAPVAVQVVSTPIHLLGLDLYNRPTANVSARLAKISSEWFVSCVARMGRILPAFGVGGVVNSSVRRNLMESVEARP